MKRREQYRLPCIRSWRRQSGNICHHLELQRRTVLALIAGQQVLEIKDDEAVNFLAECGYTTKALNDPDAGLVEYYSCLL